MQIWTHDALMGALLLVGLALLHAVVWRTERSAFSRTFAAAFALMGAAYALDPWLQPVGDRPNVWFTTLRAPAVALLCIGLIDYLGIRGRVARRLRAGMYASLAVLLACLWADLLVRPVIFATYACWVGTQALLVARTLPREPRSGHGLLLGALCIYLGAFVLAQSGYLPVPALRYVLLFPAVLVGMTVLATSLLRSQARLRAELARVADAEAIERRLNADLEQRVEVRTAELNQMVQTLESFNRTVSHDLRGPLGGIAGLARLADEALARGDMAPARRALPAIAAQADASVQLVAALLSLARAGRVELQPQQVDLNTLLASTLEQLRLADSQGTALRVMQTGRLPVVDADPDLLRQVYVNLITNAAKFSRDQARPEIEVGFEASGAGPVFYVRDNGVGFDAQVAGRLFEPFHRLHGARFEGHGLGLSIVKRIVERHGGRVWADGREGGGATFRFTLGAVPALPTAACVDAPTPSAP